MKYEDEIARDVDEKFFQLKSDGAMTADSVCDALMSALRQQDNRLRAKAILDVAEKHNIEPIDVRRAYFAPQDKTS